MIHYGSVKIGEVIAPIHDLYLVPGGFELRARIVGPAEDSGEIQLFTSQGQPVTDPATKPGEGVHHEFSVDAGAVYNITVTMTLDYVRGGE